MWDMARRWPSESQKVSSHLEPNRPAHWFWNSLPPELKKWEKMSIVHHYLLEKCKSKLQWGTTSHRSEWPPLKNIQVKYWRGFGVKGTLLHCCWESKLVQSLQKIVWKFLRKLRIWVTIWSSNPTPGDLPRQNSNLKRYIHTFIHSSTIAKVWIMVLKLFF